MTHLTLCARFSISTPSTGVRPTAAILDAVCRDRPIAFECFDGHSTWANTAAIEALGIGPATPDPPFGKIERVSADDPTPSGTSCLSIYCVSFIAELFQPSIYFVFVGFFLEAAGEPFDHFIASGIATDAICTAAGCGGVFLLFDILYCQV